MQFLLPSLTNFYTLYLLATSKLKGRYWVRKIFSKGRKERANELNKKIFFMTLVRMIVNIITSIFVLFNLVAQLIPKQDTNYRNYITAKEAPGKKFLETFHFRDLSLTLGINYIQS